MRCPACHNHLLQKSGSRVRVRTRGPIVFGADGVCWARCYWCGEPIEIPLELRKGLSVKGEQYIIPNKS